MHTRKKINVSESLHQRITQESERLGMSQKDYLEATASFFLDRQLDPHQYQPEATKQMLQQAVDRVLSYLVAQEKYLLKSLLTEAAKARILSEVSVNHLLTLLAEDEATLRQMQQQDQQYLAERLRQAVLPNHPNHNDAQ